MKLFGITTLILGIGDSFHLVPRVIALVSGKGFEYFEVYLGIGKFITSITMTVFYVILYYIYKDRGFANMRLAITLSFGFYAPVVLFSGINEAFGLLMIPKTLAYVWIVLIDYFFYMNGVKNDSK